MYKTKALEIIGESKVSDLKVRQASGVEEVLEVDGAIAAMAVDKFINKRAQLIPQYK